MAEVGLEKNVVATKRGMPVYASNPSVPAANGLPTRARRIQIPGGSGAVIVDNSTGEVKGFGGMGFWWEEEVDKARFLKIFEGGVKDAGNLSSTAAQVFHIVLKQVMENPGKDEVKLNQYVAKDFGLNERTYRRGVRELLEKQILFRSPSDGVFFININYLFNGDRLAFVKTYHLKGAKARTELPFAEPPALLAPTLENS